MISPDLMTSLTSIQLPSIGVIAPPPPGLGWALVTGFQAAGIVGRYSREISQPLPYSKFSKAATDKSASDGSSVPLLSGRLGMFIAYLPAFLLGAYAYQVSGQQNLAALLLMIHFAKRLLEVLLVHKYSGTMEATIAAAIAAAYSLDTWIISSTALTVHEFHPSLQLIGLLLFVVGQVGNGYHHYVLSTLRTTGNAVDQTKRYVAPRGGFFRYVAAPHYLFELVSWLGIALCAQEVNAFLSLFGFVSYLMGRSHKANEFYKQKFDPEEWPRTRKNLVPLLW
jgi:protein-S-isoprenylcysteine O-methyltransferase Ste14